MAGVLDAAEILVPGQHQATLHVLNLGVVTGFDVSGERFKLQHNNTYNNFHNNIGRLAMPGLSSLSYRDDNHIHSQQ